jgi:hypothetical protein
MDLNQNLNLDSDPTVRCSRRINGSARLLQTVEYLQTSYEIPVLEKT